MTVIFEIFGKLLSAQFQMFWSIRCHRF